MSGLRLKQYRYMGLDCRLVGDVQSETLIELTDSFLSDCVERKVELSFVSPMKISLVTGVSESGEMWGFDVIASAKLKPRNKNYFIYYPDNQFRCQDFDLSMAEPTIIRVYRVCNKEYCHERILACLPFPIVESIQGRADFLCQMDAQKGSYHQEEYNINSHYKIH